MDTQPNLRTETIDDVWQAHHRSLVDLGSRMLRDRAAAEDVVQDAFGRLATVELAEIHDARAWLTVVVRRLCLNRLGSAYARRESVAEAASLEQPGVDAGAGLPDPLDRVTLDDQVQAALAVVLDRLSPGERTAFVLHDVFGFPFDAIGQIVGRTAAACRQLASRGRRGVRDASPSLETVPAGAGATDEHRRLAERFIAACAGGDIDSLIAALDPDVVGGATLADGQPVGHGRGARVVAKNLLRLFGPGTDTQLVPVVIEDSPGFVALVGGQVSGVSRLDVTDEGLVHHIHAVVTRPIRG